MLTLNHRLAMRQRPDGVPLMHQTWGKLLFAHWPVAPEALRRFLPAGLELDLYEDQAWVTLSPFALWNVRLSFTPPVPLLSSFLEVNLRTYVTHEQVPGVLFLSLDTNSGTTVMGARTLFHLPYYYAQMEQKQEGRLYSFRSQRAKEPGLTVEACWERGQPLGPAEPGSLDFFLVERYCLFTVAHEELRQARIHHRPWPLETARLHELKTTLPHPFGLELPASAARLHHAEELSVEVWRLTQPEKVRPLSRPVTQEAPPAA